MQLFGEVNNEQTLKIIQNIGSNIKKKRNTIFFKLGLGLSCSMCFLGWVDVDFAEQWLLSHN